MDKNIKMSYLNLTLYLGEQKKVCSGLKDETTNGNMRSALKKERKIYKPLTSQRVVTEVRKTNKQKTGMQLYLKNKYRTVRHAISLNMQTRSPDFKASL